MQIVHCLKVSACILPDFAVLTLREEVPSADSCGDLFLERPMEGLLPLGCGAEAVFNFSWEKEVDPFGSGDDDDDDDDDKDEDKDGHDKSDHKFTTSTGTTIIPTRALLSTTANFHANRSTSSVGVRNVSVTPNRSLTRLPPRFTPSLESRYSSFHHLLRLHMNTFNQRLSMLERNTLDMKESVQRIEDQQKLLSSQLTELISIQSTAEKNQRVTELEKGYSDMESRLNRLEGRLEILIDGFTALAQEMNKMKRARHGSRSPHERRALPLATVLPLPLYTTTHPPVRVTERPFSTRAPVPISIPTPGLSATKVASSPRQERKLKPAATNTSVKSTTPLLSVTKTSKNQVSTRSRVKLKTTLNKPTSKSTSQATEKPETKRPESRRSTVTPKQVLQASSTKPKEAQKEAAITKFQLEPPSYSPTPAKPDQTRRKNSTIPRKSNRHNKAFRSDAPDLKKAQEAVKTSEGNSKKLAEANKGNSNHRNSQSFPPKTNNSTQNTITTAKPTKATTAKKPNTTGRSKSTSPKAKATTAKKKSNTTVKRKSSTAKTKKNTAKKVSKKIQQKKSPVIDLMQLLHSDHKSAKQKKNRESSLHVVLGRLAIPIKIIPDF